MTTTPYTLSDAAAVGEKYVHVAVPVPLRQRFTYTVPAELDALLRPGVRVAVPFGPRRSTGFVVDRSSIAPAGIDPSRLRAVLAVLDPEPVFPDELFQFLREAADYYLCPLGEVLRTAAPAFDRRVRASVPTAPDEEPIRARWARVREEKFVCLTAAAAGARSSLRGARQIQLATLLEARGEVPLSEIKTHIASASAVVSKLLARGLVHVVTREIPDDPFFGAPLPRDAPPALVPAQAEAVDALVTAAARAERATFLLHGVTGSGKTEVYLRAVEAVQATGRGALILLPEIALTPQLVARYRARFGDHLAVLHSGLKENDRYSMWRRLRSGSCSVAIGARSALFAPVRDLGLIVVDEEHDSSFKQDDSFRYHARDLAILRAHRAGALCVLGSATPSIESFHAAMQGRYQLLSLPERATAATLPAVELVDLRKVGRRGPTGQDLLSLPMVRALGETLARGEQAIVFLNRRGFAPSVRCTTCDKVLECPACSVALVLHRRQALLRCHYCDHAVAFDGHCLHCKGDAVELHGVGTEKIEQAIIDSFPGARVGRLDRDVASGLGAERVLERLRNGELDVLVGTQMVTKGHDIPRVTMVGVIAADSALSFPDFRASERTFQLLSQVAGRAGRGDRPGRVLIQTFQPEHVSLRCAQAHDYGAFYAQEVRARHELGYPPFGRLIAFRFDGVHRDRVEHLGRNAAGHLSSLRDVQSGAVRVLGPVAAPLERLRDRYRFHLLLKGATRPALRRVAIPLIDWLGQNTGSPERWSVDVDPVQML